VAIEGRRNQLLPPATHAIALFLFPPGSLETELAGAEAIRSELKRAAGVEPCCSPVPVALTAGLQLLRARTP